MRTILLPIYNIRIEIVGQVGSISSDLTNDGIESLILACAVAGVDVESPAFIGAIETAVDACCNNLY